MTHDGYLRAYIWLALGISPSPPTRQHADIYISSSIFFIRAPYTPRTRRHDSRSRCVYRASRRACTAALSRAIPMRRRRQESRAPVLECKRLARGDCLVKCRGRHRDDDDLWLADIHTRAAAHAAFTFRRRCWFSARTPVIDAVDCRFGAILR